MRAPREGATLNQVVFITRAVDRVERDQLRRVTLAKVRVGVGASRSVAELAAHHAAIEN